MRIDGLEDLLPREAVDSGHGHEIGVGADPVQGVELDAPPLFEQRSDACEPRSMDGRAAVRVPDEEVTGRERRQDD